MLPACSEIVGQLAPPRPNPLTPYPGNVGFVFTNGELKSIRDIILDNKVAAPARAGAVAPADVYVPAGNTGMEPGKTSFFQALGIPTKIARGTIEITTDLKLVEAGGKVGPSEATLLNMLNISPFTYGMGIAQVYDDGQCFAASVLDIAEDDLIKAFLAAVQSIASLSLAVGYPTLPSIVHSLINSYKTLVGVALATEYSWDSISELKDRIANPDAYAAAAPAAGADAAADTSDAPKAAEKEEGSDEESEDGVMPLFAAVGFRLADPHFPQVVSVVSLTSLTRCILFGKEGYGCAVRLQCDDSSGLSCILCGGSSLSFPATTLFPFCPPLAKD